MRWQQIKQTFKPSHPFIRFEQRSQWDIGVQIFGIHMNLVMMAIWMVVMGVMMGVQGMLLITPLLIIHEFGHAWALRIYNIPVQGMYFAPPLGLAIVPGRMWSTREEEADIALMGPLWGLATAVITYILWLVTGNPLWASLTFYGCYLNLFNLMPVNPLDGGRIAKSTAWSLHPHVGMVMDAVGIGTFAYLAITGIIPIYLALMVVFFGYREILANFESWQSYLRLRRSMTDKQALTLWRKVSGNRLLAMETKSVVLRFAAYLATAGALVLVIKMI